MLCRTACHLPQRTQPPTCKKHMPLSCPLLALSLYGLTMCYMLTNDSFLIPIVHFVLLVHCFGRTGGPPFALLTVALAYTNTAAQPPHHHRRPWVLDAGLVGDFNSTLLHPRFDNHTRYGRDRALFAVPHYGVPDYSCCGCGYAICGLV